MLASIATMLRPSGCTCKFATKLCRAGDFFGLFFCAKTLGEVLFESIVSYLIAEVRCMQTTHPV